MKRASKEWGDAPAVKSREVLGPMDEPIVRYKQGIDNAENRSALVDEMARWPVLAADALEQARDPDFDWDVWRSGLELERKGKFAGETFAIRYGAIIMPAAMIDVMLVAARFQVPFGLSYLRLWETTALPRRVGVRG